MNISSINPISVRLNNSLNKFQSKTNTTPSFSGNRDEFQKSDEQDVNIFDNPEKIEKKQSILNKIIKFLYETGEDAFEDESINNKTDIFVDGRTYYIHRSTREIDDYVADRTYYIFRKAKEIKAQAKGNYSEIKSLMKLGKKSNYNPIQISSAYTNCNMLEFQNPTTDKKGKIKTQKLFETSQDNSCSKTFNIKDGLKSYSVTDRILSDVYIEKMDKKNLKEHIYIDLFEKTGQKYTYSEDGSIKYRKAVLGPNNKVLRYETVFNDYADQTKGEFIEYNHNTGLYNVYVINPETNYWELYSQTDNINRFVK